MQVRRLALTTDFSPCARQAYAPAGDFARQLGSRLELLHVIQYPLAYDPPVYQGSDGAFETYRAMLREKLVGEAEGSAFDGLEVGSHLLEGFGPEAIWNFARENDVDLVVQASHGYTGLKHLVLGSFAERVLRTAVVPVLTVKNAEKQTRFRPERILFPCDLSPCSRGAVQVIRFLAEQYRSKVLVLHAWSDLARVAAVYGIGGEVVPVELTSASEDLNEKLRGRHRGVCRAGAQGGGPRSPARLRRPCLRDSRGRRQFRGGPHLHGDSRLDGLEARVSWEHRGKGGSCGSLCDADCSPADGAAAGVVGTAMIDMDVTQIRALLEKYSRPGPRYTSYPAAPHFHGSVRGEDYADHLRQIGTTDDASLSLYVHIPFCEQRCAYCGCFVIPTRNRAVAEQYTRCLDKEFRLVRALLRSDTTVDGLHLGGGTPSYLVPAELEALFHSIGESFPASGARKVSVELDPRVTGAEQLEVLRARGTNRVSLGVQDTSDEVQAAIGRHQTREQTADCLTLCRRMGIEGINVDLVYGLPLQTEERFERTLEDVLAFRPDRLAVFAYAHVPWVRPHQKAIDPETLPGVEERCDLFLLAHEKLTASGYIHVGLDHYALPGDELLKAQETGALARNFMGYTSSKRSRVLGFGVSSIGDLHSGYFQNEKKLSRYLTRLERQELPVERGWLSTSDDRMRRFAIQETLCNLKVDHRHFERQFGVPFLEYFEEEGDTLRMLEADGLVELAPQELRVREVGRLFLRNIAMVFDSYLGKTAGEGPVYSRTV